MLEAVTQEVDDRLTQSLHSAVDALLNLPKVDHPEQVENSPLTAKPWGLTAQVDRHSSVQPLPSNMTIWDVFEQPQLRRQLLILGAPGSGKTTSMLEIVGGLVKLAKADNTQPIPVLVSLSAWQGEEAFIWLVAELKSKYGIREDLGQSWLKAGLLLPLLDGLDEVRPEFQTNCAEKLNGWLTGDLERRPAGLVVCCRVEEYEEIVQQRLFVSSAVRLQPLEPAQISQYLQRFKLSAIAEEVTANSSLQKLLRKPLFLSIFGLVAAQNLFNLEDWNCRQTEVSKQAYLFELYWEAAMSRMLVSPLDLSQGKQSKTYDKKSLPSKNTVRKSLVFIAKGLNGKTEFLIERIQPAWLINEQGKSIYESLYAVILICSYSGILSIASFSSYLSPYLGFLVFTFPLLKYLMERNSIIPAERLSFHQLKSSAKNLFSDQWKDVFRLAFSLISIFLTLGAHVLKSINFVWVTIAVVIITGVVINSFVRWLFYNVRADIQIPLEANQGIKNSWKNILLFIAIVLFLSTFLIFRFNVAVGVFSDNQFSLQVIVAYIIYIAGCAAFEGGGNALLQHFCLRLVLWRNGYAPPRYDKLLNYCTERLLLQRIGGRYRFMHRLLQEHFAAMDLD